MKRKGSFNEQFRPKWLSPGMGFLRFLAKSTHLQLLSEEDYRKLIKEMPAALDVLYGNTKCRFSVIFLKRNLLSLSLRKDLSFPNDRIYQNLSIGKPQKKTY
jgi:hypothetical protein